jgi:Tfp pilus tip-associated adhesin PilY1
VDKVTKHQQYFFGLFDEGAKKSSAYKKTDLVEIKTEIISAYAIDEDGNEVDLNGNGVGTDDLRQYRTVSCDSPDSQGRCNPTNSSWVLKLATPGNGSERVISQPLVVGGIVFFTTFIPDSDVCEGNGDTWLFAVDWKTGEFVDNQVFDINGNDEFDKGDKEVKDTSGSKRKIAGIYIGTGKPSEKLSLYNDILYAGTTNEPPKAIKVNLKNMRTRLRSWKQKFN